MATEDTIRSSNPSQSSTNQVQSKLIAAETEESELNPAENSSKRRKTDDSAASEKVEIGVDEEVNWCHHGHLSGRDSVVVKCNKCQSKKFCVACIAKWYPNVSHEEFVKACPVCCNNCNCKSCLCGFSVKDMQHEYPCSELDKIKYSKYILQNVLPGMTGLNQEQLTEKEVEAKVKGLSISELQVEDAIFCNYCGAYLFDLYRSCACGYSLCLLCCRDLRDGQLQWKVHVNGSIPCPPKDLSGCDYGILELKHIMRVNWVSSMLEKAQEIQKITSCGAPQTSMKRCTRNDEENEENENSTTKSLYSLSGKDIEPEEMQNFQFHWSKGEPIIVCDVLSTSHGLSWEPMVLWRAFYTQESSSLDFDYEVNAINCLDWSEVSIDLYKFFRGYLEGWPVNLKLEDWQPDSLTEEEWPRHFVEFLRILPFKEYTHPHNGYLNMAVKLNDLSLQQIMGPKMDIAYGYSVTKLHCDTSDTVSVLTHTSTKLKKTKMAEQKLNDQDVVDLMEGGAMWDVFRRQDTPKLEEYLRNHTVKLIVHPIHDRTFYLNSEHKRKLKEEFGIEPWTFRQKLGDAVFIPAGCPYQVINLRSNTKVELKFVSPESLGECIRLQHELRKLPNDHKAQQQKLNIGKMMIYALDHAVKDLSGISDSNQPVDDVQFIKVPETINGIDEDISNHNGWIYETENDDDGDDDDEKSVVGLWRGHVVGPETKELLQAVEHHYPTTFQEVHFRSETIWVLMLKQLHTVIKGFMETEVDVLTENQITTLHEDLKEFEKVGFDLSWAHQRLNMVEILKFQKNAPELAVLEESLEPLKEKLVQRLKKLAEAYEMLQKARLEYTKTKHARNKKVQEMENYFGVHYDGVLNGKLGFGMLAR